MFMGCIICNGFMQLNAEVSGKNIMEKDNKHHIVPITNDYADKII